MCLAGIEEDTFEKLWNDRRAIMQAALKEADEIDRFAGRPSVIDDLSFKPAGVAIASLVAGLAPDVAPPSLPPCN